MTNEEILMRAYVENKLYKAPALEPYLGKAAILWTENDPSLIWDIIVLLPDELFSEFIRRYSDCFVIDDHEHVPWVFTRVKSFEWLKGDFESRLPIALWIYQNSLILQDREGRFGEVLQKQKEIFIKIILEILRKKYLEFRTERHNLRHALERGNVVAITIIKNTVVKLALEVSFLIERKPYPYKKWLPLAVQRETSNGKEVLQISEDFLNTADHKKTIELSDCLVEKVVKMLVETSMFPEDFLRKWWLNLA